jgi:dTDP-4-dehydrorhamnose reductase
MLGQDLAEVLAGRLGTPGSERGEQGALTLATRADLDLTDTDAVARAVAGHDVVVNAAAWTDVDGAESDEAGATAVNGAGVLALAQACQATGARLLHVSTDYVFNGHGTEPYPEDAPTDPVNAYGRSKLAGERAVLELLPRSGYVVRTAWLYGAHGPNFVSTMLRLERERDTLDVVDDQLGQPTWSRDLAERLVALGESDAPAGVYHGTNSGATTWFGLARAVFALVGADPDRVHPTTSDRFPRPAVRPAYSVLGHGGWARAGLPPMRDWDAALADGLAALRQDTAPAAGSRA